MERPARIVAISSGGGHWIQLQRLRPAFEGDDVAFVSVFPDYAEDVAGCRFYTVTDATRRNPWKLLRMFFELVSVLRRERPDLVITTGAAPGLIGLLAARLVTQARTMWVDSIANVERLSTSGRQARRFADVWLTQWPDLARPGGPEHWGSVL
jgi:UDP-N-acetylglucosamine:LPS N-acetylglucosamine transferase